MTMCRIRASICNPCNPMVLCSAALLAWSQLALADELQNCTAQADTAKRMECLQNNIEALQKQAASNVVQSGTKTFGQNQSDSPNFTFQVLPPRGGTSWTSPPITFAQPFGTKPSVYVAIGGVHSGINIDMDQSAYSVEPTDINETGFTVTIRRTHGLLYGIAVNWMAYGQKRP